MTQAGFFKQLTILQTIFSIAYMQSTISATSLDAKSDMTIKSWLEHSDKRAPSDSSQVRWTWCFHCVCQMDNMKENVLSFLPSWLKKFPLHFHLLWRTNNCWITEFEQKYKTVYADYKEHLMKTASRRNLEILRRKIIVSPFCKASIHWYVCWITFVNTDRRNYCQIRKSNDSE